MVDIIDSEKLRSRVRSGLGWKLATQLIGQAARFLVAVIIARLLSPHAYGLAAMAFVFADLPALFVDFSLGAVLIQRQTITDVDLSTVFWVSSASGVVATAVCIGLAPLVAVFFSAPAVGPLFSVIAISFTLYGVGTVPYALLNRRMEFRILEIREITATLLAGTVAVLLALAGTGAWAIVGQSVVSDVVATVFIWRVVRWRPHANFSMDSLRTLGSFGLKTFAARLLVYFNANLDNLLVGRFLGANSLGVYAIAYNVIFSPLTRLTRPIQQVLFPAFSRLQDDRSRLASAWLRGDALVAAVGVPAFLGMAIVAPDFVAVVLGDKWRAAVPVVQLLSIAGAFQILQSINPNVLQAVGQAGTFLRYMIASSVLTVGAFVIGLRWGIVGVAASFAIVRPPIVIVSVWLTARAVGVSFWRWFQELAPVFEISLLMALTVYLARLGLTHAGVGAALQMVILVFVGIAVYSLLLTFRARHLIREAWLLLRGGSTEKSA